MVFKPSRSTARCSLWEMPQTADFEVCMSLPEGARNQPKYRSASPPTLQSAKVLGGVREFPRGGRFAARLFCFSLPQTTEFEECMSLREHMENPQTADFEVCMPFPDRARNNPKYCSASPPPLESIKAFGGMQKFPKGTICSETILPFAPLNPQTTDFEVCMSLVPLKDAAHRENPQNADFEVCMPLIKGGRNMPKYEHLC